MTVKKVRRRKKLSNKRKILILCIIILLLFPFPIGNREGVVSSYKAVLYSYTTYRVVGKDDSYHTTREFLVFPFNLFR